MKALVTGAGGFIGGELAAALIQAGWEVRILARQITPALVKRFPESRIYAGVFGQENIAALSPAVEGCEVLFHAAAIRNRWGTSPADYNTVNVGGTEDLLCAYAQANPGGRFVYLSSVGVYGYPGCLGIDEDFPIQRFDGIEDYHSSKAAAEDRVAQYRDRVNTTIIRPTITYGRGDVNGMVTRLIAMIAKNRWIQIGDGKNFIHLTYIDDLVTGLIQAGTHPAAANQTLILSGPEPIQFRHLAQIIAQTLKLGLSGIRIPESVALAAGRFSEFLYKSLLPATARTTHAPLITENMVQTICKNRSFSSARATRLIGYHPTTNYEEGIAQTVSWMVESGTLDFKLAINETAKRS